MGRHDVGMTLGKAYIFFVCMSTFALYIPRGFLFWCSFLRFAQEYKYILKHMKAMVGHLITLIYYIFTGIHIHGNTYT